MSPIDIDKKKLSRFTAICVGGSVACLIVLSLITRFIESHPGDRLNLWIAAAAIAALMLIQVLAMRSLRGMDELEQKIHTEAMAFGFLASVLIITTCGFLALAGFMRLTLDWIAPTMMSCWLIGLLIALLRYR